MNKKILFLILVLVIAIIAVIPAAADETLFNPSFYNAGSIGYNTQYYWGTDYENILAYMSSYPDFRRDHSFNHYEGKRYDQIVCVSVNNERARDVIINFFFEEGDSGKSELQQTVFTIGTPTYESIQEVFEYFWIEDVFPWHTEDDMFFGFPSLIFRTSSTVMRFDFPKFETEGLDYMTVDYWSAEGRRLGVG